MLDVRMSPDFRDENALKTHSLEHSEPGAQNRTKSTPWGTFRPGPLSRPCEWRLGSQYHLSFGRLLPYFQGILAQPGDYLCSHVSRRFLCFFLAMGGVRV